MAQHVVPDNAFEFQSLQRFERTVLFVDVVRSVELISDQGAAVLGRWIALMRRVREDLCPANGGALVKSTGDGLLLEFGDPRGAVRAGLALRAMCREGEADRPAADRIRLRLGAATCEILRGEGDIFGHGVNLAARLMQLAEPGEFLASASTCDRLTDGLDADFEDLGLRWLRHVEEPIRAYRLGPVRKERSVPRPRAVSLQPRIAVLPFRPRGVGKEAAMLGDVLAEELIAVLSAGAPELSMLSRLSTSALAGRGLTAAEIGARLSADYVVAGAFGLGADRIDIWTEVIRAQDETVIWSGRERMTPGELAAMERGAIMALASACRREITDHEISRARVAPLSTLDGYTLMISAVALYHRLSRRDFDFAETLLEHLVDRDPGRAAPGAWLGSWHVMRVQQGWTTDRRRDAGLALDLVARALDLEPDSAIAHIARGSVAVNLQGRLDIAEAAYDEALSLNPDEPRGWALQGALSIFQGDGAQALQSIRRAIELSPMDPHRFLFESFSASAHFVNGEDAAALAAAERSLRANRRHASTLRVKAAAQWRMGREQDARATLKELLSVQPELTRSGYVAASPAPDSVGVTEVARLLGLAGLPD